MTECSLDFFVFGTARPIVFFSGGGGAVFFSNS